MPILTGMFRLRFAFSYSGGRVFAACFSPDGMSGRPGEMALTPEKKEEARYFQPPWERSSFAFAMFLFKTEKSVV